MADLLLDIFSGDAFGLTSMTEAIEVIPNTYGRLNELGIFREEGVATNSVVVEYEAGNVHLLRSTPRGTDGTGAKPGKRRAQSFVIPHIPHEDRILAGDFIGVRAFGKSGAVSYNEIVNRRLAAMKAKHAITWENLRWGALAGKILDADGSLILDLGAAFGAAIPTVSFNFANSSLDVTQLLRAIKRGMELNALGETITGIKCLCSPEFFDAFIHHPQVVAAYTYFTSQQNPLRQDVRSNFVHEGIEFEEYLGYAQYLGEDGKTVTGQRFVPAGQACFIPLGTTQMFVQYNGPANFIETAFTPGLPLYAKQSVDPRFQRFVDIWTESNPLPLVLRPNIVTWGTIDGGSLNTYALTTTLPLA